MMRTFWLSMLATDNFSVDNHKVVMLTTYLKTFRQPYVLCELFSLPGLVEAGQVESIDELLIVVLLKDFEVSNGSPPLQDSPFPALSHLLKTKVTLTKSSQIKQIRQR